ncbi:uncharacterized protein LOC114325248 [Diabrotica virgifera virgifera]|uniref:Coiled-coil protein 142 C-terminal domain-containing protein n=1 Tax=Diabrotica virgifera virgifera TaxID=50390 RepID=A0ABM5IB86_DIAVI|nr:uncharacterized protein LOC114325248 [Diabrotica virgifera virgifera]
MTWNAHIIQKWLPPEILNYEELFASCRNLENTCGSLTSRLEVLLNNLKSKHSSKFNPLLHDNDLQLTDVEDITLTLESIEVSYKNILPKLAANQVHCIIANKLQMWKDMLWKAELQLIYFVQEIINEITHLFIYYGESLLVQTLRISVSYNNLLVLDKKYHVSNDNNICKNTCPYLIFPMRSISVTRLLQIIAYKRAELCCHKLIDCLLETYRLYENSDDDDDGSDNSSLEIYMTLTKHMSPPDVAEKTITKEASENINDSSIFASLEELIYYEEKNVIDLLTVTLQAAPEMLGHDGVRKSKSSGVKKISPKAREKVLEYYEQILWGEVGNFLEHVVLWWSASPLSARPPHSSQHLREWIVQFIPTADVSPVVLSALASLADALGVHVASTSWDQNFRLALVSSKAIYNPETGKLYANVLQDLVVLCNQCETTPDWFVGAPLDELPLVEQIPVLHRLDHSIHTTRLWSINECKKLVNAWNVSAFFTVIHDNIVDCLSQLNNLRLADHAGEIEKKNLGVQVEVCVLMRAKLVSEVKVNFDKLKEAPKECVDGLASVCRTICLANLQMIFPPSSYWKKTNSEMISETPSVFVAKYLDRILVPVLEATNDHQIANMILTLICESWLDHIYLNKIKFSHCGAYQLLCDFGYILVWLSEYPTITATMRKKLMKNEVLKRCEGVGRLLLRRPGERIKMTDKSKKPSPPKDVEDSQEEEEKGELMPAEMYVPNQEQWLELRALKKKTTFPMPICCGQP